MLSCITCLVQASYFGDHWYSSGFQSWTTDILAGKCFFFFFFWWGCCPVHPRIFSSILAFSLAIVALYCQDICLQILPSVPLRGKIASSWELVYIEDKIKTTQPNFLTHVWSHTTCPSLSHTTPSRYRPSIAHLTPFHLYSCYYFCAHAETTLPLFLWTRNK